MQPLRLLLLSLFTLLFAGPVVAADSINQITEDLIRDSVQKKQIPLALSIHKAGGFRGFQPSPNSTAETDTPIADFLIQDIAIDADGNPTDENPLTAAHTRDLRSGDKLPYLLSNYPAADENPKFPGHRMHRYAFHLADGSDHTGARYPVIAGLRDTTPDLRNSAEYGTLGMRDGVSMIGIFPEYACYMGVFAPRIGGFSLSTGAGYADKNITGMARFAHPFFPNPVPKLGARWQAAVLQKTITVGRKSKTEHVIPHQKNLLVAQLVIGTRLMYRYGTRDNPTPPLDTIVNVSYGNLNSLGTAPAINNKSPQLERIYLTRKLGYATRWELWACVEGHPKDVLKSAQKTYRNSVAPPASIEGQYTEHFELGPTIDDKELGAYKHTQTITDPETGKKETRTWYLIGCHDWTNIRPQKPADPAKIVPLNALSPVLLDVLGIKQN